ncbi:MAG: hypothetical protein P1V35_15120 [Planctomycetota bacterium]|nr:hypothetical protein [Planctomycetota bacterium]
MSGTFLPGHVWLPEHSLCMGQTCLARYFRLDEILTFEALTPEQLGGIVKVQIERLAAHLADQDLTIAAQEQLAKEGYDPEYGARPLKRAIQKRILNPIADAILAGKLSRGQVAHIDWTGSEFRIEAKEVNQEEMVA